MDVQQTLTHAQDALTVKRVYGEPYEQGGMTIIPAAAVRGAGGGGSDDAGQGGAGFGLKATPKGAWVIEDGEATWKPAIDVNRIVLGGQVVAFAAIMTAREIVRLRARRRPLTRALTIRPARRPLSRRLLQRAHAHH